jgi:hypothetical protein
MIIQVGHGIHLNVKVLKTTLAFDPILRLVLEKRKFSQFEEKDTNAVSPPRLAVTFREGTSS